MFASPTLYPKSDKRYSILRLHTGLSVWLEESESVPSNDDWLSIAFIGMLASFGMFEEVVCNTKAQYNQIIKKEIIFRSRFLFVYCCHGSLSNIVICWRLVGEVCFQYTNTIKSYNKKGNSPFTNSTPTFIFLIFVFVFCFLGVFQWFFFARFCFVVLLSCSCCPYRLFCFSAFGNAYHLVPFLACIILIGGL